MDWLAISNSGVFKPTVMNAIINEFVPDPNALLLTQKFMPRKDANDDRLIALIKNGAYGVTAAAVPGAEHFHLAGLGGRYVEAKVPEWRESIVHLENELLKIRKPENPNEIWGLDIMTSDLSFLNIRLNNRIEQVTADTVFLNGYTINNYGIQYTYNAGVSSRYRVYMGDTVPSGMIETPWIAKADANLWTAPTTCKPLRDIQGIRSYAGELGLKLTGLVMNSKTAGYIEAADSVTSIIQSSPVLAEKYMTIDMLISTVGGLKGLPVTIDDRIYNRETYVVTAAAAGASTITVRDAKELGVTNSDYFIIRNGTGQSERVKVHASTSINTSTPGAHIISLAAVTTIALAVQDRVTFAKKFVPEGYVAFEVARQAGAEPANWISIPSLVGKANGRATPGVYNWSYVKPANQPPLMVEVGMGINGGAVVFDSGGWIILKVA